VSHFPGRSSPSGALGEGFPECFWLFPECLRHSGKQVAPVVEGVAELGTLKFLQPELH
jgi:hypothetical protein